MFNVFYTLTQPRIWGSNWSRAGDICFFKQNKLKKKSPKPESQKLRGVVYRPIEYLASMGHSSIWKLICAICVFNILTVGVHLSSTPSISGPGSATGFPFLPFLDYVFCCLIWFFTSKSTIFQLCPDGSSWFEPVLSKDYCVLLKDTMQWCWRCSNHNPWILRQALYHWASALSLSWLCLFPPRKGYSEKCRI